MKQIEAEIIQRLLAKIESLEMEARAADIRCRTAEASNKQLLEALEAERRKPAAKQRRESQ